MDRHENYRAPEEANSPKDMVEVHRILYDGGTEDVSIARGTWDKVEALLMRWNGGPDQRNGFPARFDNMTWMVVPDWMRHEILNALAKRIESHIVGKKSDVPFGGKK